jgi:hypothetical protein
MKTAQDVFDEYLTARNIGGHAPPMSGSDLLQELEAAGFYVIRNGVTGDKWMKALAAAKLAVLTLPQSDGVSGMDFIDDAIMVAAEAVVKTARETPVVKQYLTTGSSSSAIPTGSTGKKSLQVR